MNFVAFYFLFISNISFLFFGADKFQAKKGRSRISENILLIVTLFGGTLGPVLGMIIFRHKISKTLFLFKIIVIIILQILFYIYYIK